MGERDESEIKYVHIVEVRTKECSKIVMEDRRIS